MTEFLTEPWPWYVAGPAIGLLVPVLLITGNRLLGFASSFRHTCTAVLPGNVEFFKYDWRRTGAWSLAFMGGTLIGGFIGGWAFGHDVVAISIRTQTDLAALGIRDFTGLVPRELFQWSSLLTPKGFVVVVIGGFLVGFGTAYAGGCTSGHGITGLADLQKPSLIALIGFFAGGLIGTFAIMPLIL